MLLAQQTWQLPDRDLILENEGVLLRPVSWERDRVDLWKAVERSNRETDLFRFHINVGPFSSLEEFSEYFLYKCQNLSELTFSVFSKRLQRLVGCCSVMNVRTDHGTAEIGSIWYETEAQRTEINTNTMFLVFEHLFEVLGYRRLEWKCNSENLASARAAERLGFTFEGKFRQHFVSRGANRDTLWYSIIDSEWPAVRARLESLRQPRQGAGVNTSPPSRP